MKSNSVEILPKAPGQPTPFFHCNHFAGHKPNAAIDYAKTEPLPYLRMCRLIQAAQAGDIDARNTIWVSYARLTYGVINRFHVPPHLFDDALQAGVVGLYRAIQKFDIARLTDFTTYAWHWIRQAIQRFLRKTKFGLALPGDVYRQYATFRREWRAKASNREREVLLDKCSEQSETLITKMCKLHALIETRPLGKRPPSLVDRQPNPHEEMEHAELSVQVEQCLNRLKPRERDVITRRYGLLGFSEHTLDEVGQLLGVTRERIRQIEAKVEHELRRLLAIYVKDDARFHAPYTKAVEEFAAPDRSPSEIESPLALPVLLPFAPQPLQLTLFPVLILPTEVSNEYSGPLK